MDDQYTDRMATPRRRGPPSKLETTTPLPSPQQAEEVDLPQPPLRGIRCPGCGRGMVPRRDRIESDAKCYAQCSLCGARMVLTFSAGKPSTVRLIRPGDPPR